MLLWYLLVQNPDYLSPTQAARLIAKFTGKKPHQSAVRRWCIKGVRGRKLPSQRQGDRFLIRKVDLINFLQAPTEPTVAEQVQTNAALSALLGRSYGNVPAS